MEERIVRKLMASVRCNSCGQLYHAENVQVLGHHQQMWFFNVYCSACKNQVFIAASVTSETASLITDLTPADYLRLQRGNPLTADDVLDMHSYLKGYQGNITGLFNTNAFNT